MDLNEATQIINWLESERKKDKAALATLQEKAQGLATELADQVKRIQDLQTALAETQRSLAKMPQYDKLLEQFKIDLVGEMDRRESKYQRSVQEMEQLRKVEWETVNHSLADIRKELPRFKPLEDEMPMRRAEERRLQEQIARINQRVEELAVRTEERVQNVVYLEEGRRQDSKRIAQLEEGHTSVLKRVEAFAAKTVLLDENLQRLPPRIVEVVDRLGAQDKIVEEMRRNDFRHSQQIKSFIDQVTRLVEPISDYMATSQADYQRVQELVLVNQRSVDEIQAFQNRIEKRQSEVGEMQRISEDRVKKQVEEWQADQEKRWKRQMIVWNEQWQEHDRLHQGWEARLEHVEQTLPGLEQQFKIAWDGLDEFIRVYLAAARQVAEAQQATLEKARPSKVVLTGEQIAAAKKSS